MMRRIFSLMLLLFPALAWGQEMVKINVLGLYDRIPAPPADVRAAYARHECKEENTVLRCNVDKFYQPILNEYSALAEQLKKLNMLLNTPAPSSVQKMDSEEIRKKMASMSMEEKVQFAMAMTQQMGLGPKALTPESEEVIAAQEECSKISRQFDFAKRAQLMQERGRQHGEIEEWNAAESRKIPLVGDSEAGKFPEPKATYALAVSVVDKHLAVENAYLQALQKLWPEELEERRTLYTPFQQKLAAANYGEEAANVETKRVFAAGQSMMLWSSDALIKLSRSATEEAARWWLQKLDLEKKKLW